MQVICGHGQMRAIAARGDHSLCKALSALIVLTPHFYCPNLRFTDCNLALTCINLQQTTCWPTCWRTCCNGQGGYMYGTCIIHVPRFSGCWGRSPFSWTLVNWDSLTATLMIPNGRSIHVSIFDLRRVQHRLWWSIAICLCRAVGFSDHWVTWSKFAVPTQS